MSLNAEDTLNRVKQIISEQLGVDLEKVTRKAHFIDDLGADSLDTVELVMALEQEFAVRIPDEDAEKISNLDEVLSYINKTLDENKLKAS